MKYLIYRHCEPCNEMERRGNLVRIGKYLRYKNVASAPPNEIATSLDSTILLLAVTV